MFWRIWVRPRLPSHRPLQDHARVVAVTFSSDDLEAFTMTHVRNVDGRHRIVGEDPDLKTVRAIRERAFGE